MSAFGNPSRSEILNLNNQLFFSSCTLFKQIKNIKQLQQEEIHVSNLRV